MKFLAKFSRILVGLEFIFSGFVKVVDPYGTGLKLKEYFEVFSLDLPALSSIFGFFAHNSLWFSLLFCVLEFTLGFALLFKFKMKWSAWIVLLMMSFFTFLTFYSAFYNKVTDCGCFGDFLKLKPWDSFYKDVISMVFILIIFIYRNKFENSEWGTPLTWVGLLISLGLGFYGIYYLPILDFLPYAQGKSIKEQMQIPNIKPDISYTFLDKELKKEIEAKEFLMDTTRFKYLSSKTLNEDDIRPKITDYSLTDSAGVDFTAASFEGKKLLIVIKKPSYVNSEALKAINSSIKAASNAGIGIMLMSSVAMSELGQFVKINKINVPFYTTDEKVLKTMARNHVVFYLLNKGQVTAKWPYSQMPDLNKIKELTIYK
jgi:uncharacterized membrane protein YphA (DoxX/SURF4 family)